MCIISHGWLSYSRIRTSPTSRFLTIMAFWKDYLTANVPEMLPFPLCYPISPQTNPFPASWTLIVKKIADYFPILKNAAFRIPLPRPRHTHRRDHRSGDPRRMSQTPPQHPQQAPRRQRYRQQTPSTPHAPIPPKWHQTPHSPAFSASRQFAQSPRSPRLQPHSNQTRARPAPNELPSSMRSRTGVGAPSGAAHQASASAITTSSCAPDRAPIFARPLRPTSPYSNPRSSDSSTR